MSLIFFVVDLLCPVLWFVFFRVISVDGRFGRIWVYEVSCGFTGETLTMKQTPFVTAQVRRLIAELRRDRRRLTVLAVLLAIVVGLGVRAMLSDGPMPAQALSKRVSPVSAAVLAESNREKFLAKTDYINRINRNQTRDLFQPDEAFFPPPPQFHPQGEDTEISFVSAAPPAEDRQQEIERRRVFQEAKSLKLQSTMFGTRTVASINDHTLAIGDQLNGFIVTDIQANGCTVEKNGVVVMLTISP